jgi:hypothetical protein
MCSKGQPISEGVELYKPNQIVNNCDYFGWSFACCVSLVTTSKCNSIFTRMYPNCGETTKRKLGKGLRPILDITVATNNYARPQESSLSSSSSYFFLPLICCMSSTDPSCFPLAIQSASSMSFYGKQSESRFICL